MKQSKRFRRKKHIRKTVNGTKDRPRLCVYKSLSHIYTQIIDDDSQKVLFGCSTLTPELKKEIKYGGNIEAAKHVGKKIAEICQTNGVKKVVFDRNGYVFHGRVKALADSAREAGLEF
ncbi:50S ribosomal protein L18 [bacterium]|nr:50S ribosomal protein L18 [bacterium]